MAEIQPGKRITPAKLIEMQEKQDYVDKRHLLIKQEYKAL